MSDTPTPTAPPKFLDSPLVKEGVRIAVAVLLAWLAAKYGVTVPTTPAPAPTAPAVLVLNVGPSPLPTAPSLPAVAGK